MFLRVTASRSRTEGHNGGRQYRLVRELASGSFGAVYLAELTAAGDFRKLVALKVLHTAWSQNSEAAERFRDEARLLGQIRHRHVVQVDGLVQFGGRWAVVMEYVPGADVHTLIKASRRAREPLSVSVGLEITAAVAAALDAAWTARPDPDAEPLRVIHRDIKPANIRITPDGDVKVLDFGIARADFSGREAMTEEVRFGTLRYMSPERRWGKPDTTAGDIYALGCVLFEILAGGPFGNAEAVPADHERRIEERIGRVSSRLDEAAAPVVDLLARMLAWTPEQRPTATEVYDACRAVIRGRTDEDLATFAKRFVPRVHDWVPDESVAVPGRPGSSSRGSLTDSQNGPGPSARATRSKWPAIGVAVLATLAAAALLTQVLPRESADAAAPPEAPVGSAASGLAPASDRDVPDPMPAPGTERETGPETEAEPVTQAVDAEPVPLPAPMPPADPRPQHVEQPAASPAPATAPPKQAAPRLRAVKFTHASDATAITVECGDVTGTGTTYAMLRDVPTGSCTVVIANGSVSWEATVDVQQPRAVHCAVQAGVLSCT